MAQQTKNRFAKRDQHCDVTKRDRKSQNNPILLWQLLNNGISFTKIHVMISKEIKKRNLLFFKLCTFFNKNDP